MKLIFLLRSWVCLLCLLCLSGQVLVVNASDKPVTFQALGLQLTLPEYWRLLTGDELQEMLASDADELQLSPGMRAHLSRHLQQGSLIWLVNTRTAEDAPLDNLNLYLSQDVVPEGRSRVRATCQLLPELLSQSLGQTVDLQRCEAVSIAGRNGLAVAYSSAQATHIQQYQLQLAADRSVYMTLTYRDEDSASPADVTQMLGLLQLD